MTNWIHNLPALGALLSLWLLPSCATEDSTRSRLPAAAAINEDAGRLGPLIVMIGLRSSERLPFLLDTGAPVTCLDKSFDSLKKKGQLPGWSRTDEFANRTESLRFHSSDSVTFDRVLKKGDASIYHYELVRPACNLPWRLHKAWRTDQNGHMIEEYPVP